MITEKQYLQAANAIENVHQSDASTTYENEMEWAAELIYSERMLQILDKLEPNPSFELKLAAQCQHLERWIVNRGSYPMDRKGYHQWRKAVMDYQLGKTSEILTSVGISQEDITMVLDIISRKGVKHPYESQLIIDVSCVVFIKWYLDPFAEKHEQEKVVDILAKTAKRMSPKALEMVSTLTLSEGSARLLAAL